MTNKKELASLLASSALKLQQMGLNHGATGNCSCRDGDTFLITPSGVDTENLLISQPDTGEQALDIAETLVRSYAVDILVVDSVAALVPRA